jgi:CheY-like chemotaxis protein
MPKTVLVIDDDHLMCTLASQALERGGYSVITASDGPTGIECYEVEKPDLIVLDVAMPEMNGFEVTSQIRALQERDGRPHIPIVLLTAYARSFFVPGTAQEQIDSYLTKPVTPDQLLAHVNKFLSD